MPALVRTFFSLLKRRLRRRESAAGGRKRPSSPRPSDKKGRLVEQVRPCGSPVPLTFECSITARASRAHPRRFAIEQVRPLTHRPLTYVRLLSGGRDQSGQLDVFERS